MIDNMTVDELRQISRKLAIYADIYTGDKEARRMSRRCWDVAALLEAAQLKTIDWADAAKCAKRAADQVAEDARIDSGELRKPVNI